MIEKRYRVEMVKDVTELVNPLTGNTVKFEPPLRAGENVSVHPAAAHKMIREGSALSREPGM